MHLTHSYSLARGQTYDSLLRRGQNPLACESRVVADAQTLEFAHEYLKHVS